MPEVFSLTSGEECPLEQLAFVASPLNSVAPNEKKTSGTQGNFRCIFLFEFKILPGVQNEDPLVRNMAVKCLGLCALLSCEFARTHLVLFLQVTNLIL